MMRIDLNGEAISVKKKHSSISAVPTDGITVDASHPLPKRSPIRRRRDQPCNRQPPQSLGEELGGDLCHVPALEAGDLESAILLARWVSHG